MKKTLIKIIFLLEVTSVTVLGQAEKKTYKREKVDHISKEVIQPRYWNIHFRQQLATVVRSFAGEVTFRLATASGNYVTVKVSQLNKEDKVELERWKYWAPRKVHHSDIRNWNMGVYDKKSNSMKKKPFTAKLLYTIGGDVLLCDGFRKKLVSIAALSRGGREYVEKHRWKGESRKMKTSGAQADVLKKAGLKAYKYEASIFGKKFSMPYQLYAPSKGVGKVPLVIFFHGIGATGSDNLAADNDSLVFVDKKNQRNNPCYFVVPQHPRGGRGWIGSLDSPSRFSYLVKEMVMELRHTHPNIDTNRIYVTGLSSGAWGTYQALAHFPYIYAAGLPVSEAIDTKFFTKENAKPMWILYNKGDKSSLVSDAKKLETHLKKLGVRPKVTVFNKGGHNAWSAAYGKSNIINWLFRQKM